MHESSLKKNYHKNEEPSLRIWVVDVDRPGHAREHAKSLADEISKQANVTLSFLKSPLSLNELMRQATAIGVDVVIMATLDTYFLKGFRLGARLVPSPRLVGVLHDTRKLKSSARQLVWKALELAGQIDRILVYTKQALSGVCSQGLIRSVRHPIGEIKPLIYENKNEVLFFGILSEEKGVGRLRVIAENLPAGYVLHVAGSCTDKSLEARLAESWQPLIDQGKIRWTKGSVEEAVKISYFRQAVCLLAPYEAAHGRASGIAIDAMRYNIPILYSTEHEWMHELFSGSSWLGAFPIISFSENALELALPVFLKKASRFRSQVYSGETMI
jgi:glycosyltransferase involved in cell wall biosynthesis